MPLKRLTIKRTKFRIRIKKTLRRLVKMLVARKGISVLRASAKKCKASRSV